MELRNLKTFLTVADKLSFHRAAETIHYAQSTVSAQVMALEQELGVRLFDRLGRRIVLTEAGSRLKDFARKMLDLADEARVEVAGQSQAQGSLCIRVPESFSVLRLGRVISRFCAAMPAVKLYFITCANEGLPQDLRKGVTDLAFLLADSIAAADLEVEPLGSLPLVLVAGPGHSLAGQRGLPVAALAGETLILSRADCSYRRLLEQLLEAEKVERGTLVEVNSLSAIVEWVGRGLGISILPRALATPLAMQGSLALLELASGELETTELMICLQGKCLPPSLAAFMEAARQELGAGP